MSQNDIILLDNLLRENKLEQQSAEPDGRYFERFTFEQVLKDYALDNDELTSGHVGGGGDGGIDGFFTFINNIMLREDTDLAVFKKEPHIEVHLVQTSREDSFKESRVDRINTSASQLFNHDYSIADLTRTYNEKLVTSVSLFREAQLKLSTRHARISMTMWFICRGDTKTIHPNVRDRASIFTNTLQAYFPS